MTIYFNYKFLSEPAYEFVERKGLGHPDTLSDNLAEYLSAEYSKYTLKQFGAILHHNFDKVGLLGGASHVKFGEGWLTKPIRVLLNGRASTKFADTKIPVDDLLIIWATEFLSTRLPLIDPAKDLEFHNNLSNQSSPGKTEEDGAEKGTRKYWFEPRSLDDLQELKKLRSNDTSMGVGYYPYTRLESIVLRIEKELNEGSFKKANRWVGGDIKIMGFRQGDSFNMTLCIPQISRFVDSAQDYKANLENAKAFISELLTNMGVSESEVHINTRDDFEKSELYLTAIGSSIESGDEGLVGRGNRINGVISPMRLMSMEGACGKNPVYHIGKLYYVAADLISRRIYETFGVANEVVLISQSGRDLLDPWVTHITLPENQQNSEEISNFVLEQLKRIPEITSMLLDHKIRMC